MSTIKTNKPYCFAWLLFFCLPVYTQTNITGRVVDEKNNAPLEASLFFNNTTISTITNSNGEFHFDAIRMFNSELVIFSPGYELLVYKAIEKQIEGRRIIFKMQKKQGSTVSRVVLATNDNNTMKTFFFQDLLGITEEAKTCKIVNKDAIYFESANIEKVLNVRADTPLVIMHNQFGYKINYYLEDGWYDDSAGTFYFTGYTRYEDMGVSKRILKKREQCYYGSTLHFYRSMINRRLYADSFAMFFLKPAKDSVVLPENNNEIVTSDATVVPLSEQDILFIDDKTNELSIKVPGKLLVQYNKNPAMKSLLIDDGILENFMSKGVESTVYFMKTTIGIKYPGVLDDYSGIQYSGYWKIEKLANKLPYNYELPTHFR